MQKWKRRARKLVHKNPWFKLWADDCELPSGEAVAPYYVIEENDWVHVVALNQKSEILVIRQYRHAGELICMEITGGVIDADEEPLQAAKRELNEETGFTATHWELVFVPMANPARQTNRIYCYFATGLEDSGETQFDETEEMVSEFVSIADLKDKIVTVAFQQSSQVASVMTVIDRKNLE